MSAAKLLADSPICPLDDDPGMTLREYYAGHAMAAMVQRAGGAMTPEAVAMNAVNYADALIERLAAEGVEA